MARIGGAFPFPTAQVSEGGGIIELASGQVWYIPAGEYLVTTGSVSVLQWFEPIQQMWRTWGNPCVSTQFISCDGFNYRLLNASGIVSGALINTAGSAAPNNGIGSVATGVTVAFSAPVSAQANQTATGYAIVGGSVAAPTITQAGSGFLTPPLIIIDPPPPGGVQATSVCTINATGGIASITMVNSGAGYTASPNFWIAPQVGTYAGGPSGSFAAGAFPPIGLVFPTNALPGNVFTGPAGAQLTSIALTGSLTLTGIVVVDPGNLYDGTHIPTVSISGMGVAPTATAIMSMSVQSVTLGSGGAGYGVGAVPMWETSLGVLPGTVTAASGSSQNNNSQFIPRRAVGLTTVGGGAVASFTVEDPGFGFQKVPVVAIENTSALSTGQATGTAVVGGINDVCVVQPRVQ